MLIFTSGVVTHSGMLNIVTIYICGPRELAHSTLFQTQKCLGFYDLLQGHTLSKGHQIPWQVMVLMSAFTEGIRQIPNMSFAKTKALGMSWAPQVSRHSLSGTYCIFIQKQIWGKAPLSRSSCSHLVLDTGMMSGPLFTKSFKNSEALLVSFAPPGFCKWLVRSAGGFPWICLGCWWNSCACCFLNGFVGLSHGVKYVSSPIYQHDLFFRNDKIQTIVCYIYQP